MEDGDAEEIKTTLEDLRDEFRQYRESTEQYERDKRVENIQVLIALSAVGGTLTILTSRLMTTPFWQNLLTSPYWITILSAFVGANALFLILKLLTIPLQPISDNRYLIYTHEVLEPFLYFFAISGVLLASIVRFIIDPLYSDLQAMQKMGVAVASLGFPFLIGFVYAQAYRINAALRRSQMVFSEVNKILEKSVKQGTLSAEERTSILRDVLVASIPASWSAYLLFIIWQSIREYIKDSDGSDREDSEQELNKYVNDYLASPTATPVTYSLIIQLFNYISETNDAEGELSEGERAELRNKIRNLRNKAVHDQLDQDDLEEFSNYLERYRQKEEENVE